MGLFVGDFDYIEKFVNSGVRIRVYAPRGKKDESKYALQEAAATLEFCQKHFEIPYVMKKMDLIALPDFAEGAMENWGMLTFKEALLIADRQTADFDSIKMIAQIIAHEVV